jgi:glutaredoxin-related protein
MSSYTDILEQMKIKPVPKTIEKIEINMPEPSEKEEITITTKIIDQTAKKTINRNDFLKKIEKSLKTQGKQVIEVQEEVPKTLTVNKGKKTKKTLKISDENVDAEVDTIVSKKRKTAKPDLTVIKEGPLTMIYIGDTKTIERLPPKKKDMIKASAYYLNNREIFVNFINALFKPYKDELKTEKRGKTEGFSIMVHQKIVRDYLAHYTPYRGLLLYHGLGSGKTCSSIAIAEGLKSDRQIIVMTPASLRRNYIEELKKCGDPIFKKNQFWEFVYIKNKDDVVNKDLLQELSKILQISENFIEKQGGAWLVNVKKKSNFDDLQDDAKSSIDNQINEMIRFKYKFINYNGLRNSHWRDMTINDTINPFDNKVVIIDEAHNFVSRIVNKLKYSDSLSQKMYQNLMTANNVKVVLLTGTPIINYPNEIAILFNILRGYIKTWSFPLNIKTTKKINKETFEQLFAKFDLLDQIEYKANLKTLTITRNPFGFINKKKMEKYIGVALSKTNDQGNVSDEDFEKIVASILKKEDIEILTSGIKINLYKALPDRLDDFKEFFIEGNGSLKNDILFKRRILGLTSYYRSAQEELMPNFDKDKDFHVEKIPMSDYQFALYEKARVNERKLEKSNKKKKQMQKKTDDIYEDAVSTYRIFSRAFCNFVFPDNKRPMPKEEEDIEDITLQTATEDLMDAATVQEKLNNPDGLYSGEDIDKLNENSSKEKDSSYELRIKEALEFLERNSANYLSKEGLQIYSPKFLNVLENIEDEDFKGLHLVYSQFRTLEGIGIFSLVLKQNGFAQFKIKRESNTDRWVLDRKETDIGKPMYALYTGTESQEEKEILRNIFNSDWNNVPDSLVDQLKPIASNNYMGELIKVLMITASGAEGITLKNVRYVHIMEPYWHPVRIEQVIGRARRIASHENLPEELRTVEVFLYLMTFSAEQTTGDKAIELRLKDRSKLDNETPLTSDEALYEIATIKEEITRKILRQVKESSIDCSIHTSGGKNKEQLKCFTFGKPNNSTFAYMPSITNEEKDQTTKANLKKIDWKAETITIEGKEYAINKKTMEVYDLDSVLDAQANEEGGNPILVGQLVKKDKKYIFKKI